MKTILIADDSASMRKLLETILTSEGHKTLIAEDGRAALKLAFDNEIDVIIADHEMPNLTGTELFKILNTDPEKRSIPRILISGLAANDDKPASELFDVFVSKNADLKTELFVLVRKVLSRCFDRFVVTELPACLGQLRDAALQLAAHLVLLGNRITNRGDNYLRLQTTATLHFRNAADPEATR